MKCILMLTINNQLPLHYNATQLLKKNNLKIIVCISSRQQACLLVRTNHHYILIEYQTNEVQLIPKCCC